MGLSLVVLLGMASVPSGARARGDDRAKQISEIEKQLAELKAKLVELKKVEPAKDRKPLALKDVLAWETLGPTALSRDGAWFAYSVIRPTGKTETVIRQTRGEKENRFPGVGRVVFSHDSRWIAFTSSGGIGGFAGRRRGQGAETPPPPMPAGKVVVLNLVGGEKLEFEGMSRFAFAGENSNLIAVYKSNSGGRGGDLLLRDLTTGKELSLGNVAEFAFDKKGDLLALVIDVQGQVGNGVQLRDMKTGVLRQLESARAVYQNLSWSEKGEAFSVLKAVEDKSLQDKTLSVVTFTDLASASPTLIAYDPMKDAAFPKGMTISTFPPPYLSEDRSALIFGIQERKKADSAVAKSKFDPTKGMQPTETARADKPDLIIWHGNEERLPAQQEKEAGRDRIYSYLCSYRPTEKKFLRLADDTLRTVRIAPKQRWAIGTDDRAIRRSRSLDGRHLHDVYVIDLLTGEKYLALNQNRDLFGPSPDGTRFLYYDKGEFYVYDMAARKSRCISKDCGTSFVNIEDDHNIDRLPTNPIGWTKDSAAVLISDNWDVWKLPVDEKEPAVNLTRDGKKAGIRYRNLITINAEEKGIDLSVPLYFSAMEEWTKKSGFVRIDPGQTGPSRLCWDDAEFGGLMKAANADVFVYTRETASEYPDYHATDAGFKEPRRLTKVNAQQDKYLWSSGSLLVDYKSAKGDRLQGALFLPANYEKGKKYPTVVYIYERLSSNKNRYLTPRSMGFNTAIYTSNGYAVFMPDIKYQINDPGMSAVWCVLPALEAAVATGCGGQGARRASRALVGRLPDGLFDHPDACFQGGGRGGAVDEPGEHVQFGLLELGIGEPADLREQPGPIHQRLLGSTRGLSPQFARHARQEASTRR